MVAATARIYRDFPALDRSEDTRPRQWLEALTAGIDDRRAVLITDLNWQLENGLHYFAKETRQDVVFARMAAVSRYARTLIQDNLAIGRDVVLAEGAATPAPLSRDPSIGAVSADPLPTATILSLVTGLPQGTRYAVCVLRPSRGFTIDESDLRQSLQRLTGDRLEQSPARRLRRHRRHGWRRARRLSGLRTIHFAPASRWLTCRSPCGWSRGWLSTPSGGWALATSLPAVAIR